MNEPNFNVHLASHYGVCFGVRDAIDATRKTFNDGKVTVLGQLVHNPCSAFSSFPDLKVSISSSILVWYN